MTDSGGDLCLLYVQYEGFLRLNIQSVMNMLVQPNCTQEGNDVHWLVWSAES